MADSSIDANDGLWPEYNFEKTFSGTVHVKPENLSAYQELGLIVTSVCNSLIDLDKKQNENLIQCIILFGGVVGQPEMSKDIDLLILFKKRVTKDIIDSVDPQTKQMLQKFLGKDSKKVSLAIDGDTITKNHEIDVVMQLSKFYLDLYNIPDEDRKRRIIEVNKNIFIGSGSFAKAEQYSQHNMTFQDSVPANGALVLYGESPIDREGKPIFEKYDKKLLKL